jgi:aryl-alcohol dehydrogenase-like predicted oxidoreductase
MISTAIGKSKLKLSVLGLGTWPFAADGFWGDQDEKDSLATIRAALDLGINLIDSAEGYGAGRSEEIVGRALMGLREKAVIATKVSAANLGKADLTAACERSLLRLKTDYIDLYQLHWPNPTIPINETMEALNRLVEDGKVRNVGYCNFGARDLNRGIAKYESVVSNQLPYSLLWRAIEERIMPECTQKKIAILVYSPLSNGLLSGKYRTARDVPTGRTTTRLFSGERPNSRHGEAGWEAETFDTIAAIRKISEETAIPMPTLAIAWALNRPNISSVLVGARTPRQLEDIVKAAEMKLPVGVEDELTRVTESLKLRIGDNADLWEGRDKSRIV